MDHSRKKQQQQQRSTNLGNCSGLIHPIYRIRKNIGEELNLANWRIKMKSPIFYLANVFCTRLTQNLARNPLEVAAI